MKRFFRQAVVAVAALVVTGLLSSEALAGAWTQKKGGYYFKLSGGYLNAGQEFNYRGKKIDILQDYLVYENTSFRDFSITSYLEYGLLDRLTLVANLPYKISTTRRTENTSYVRRRVTTTTTGLSDLTISGRLRLLQRPVVLSLQSGVKLPLGYDKTPENDGAALGTGEVDGELFLLLGQGFYPLPLYVTGGVGYRSRGGPLNDEYLFSAEIGYSNGPFLFKLAVDGVKNRETPPDLYGSLIVSPLPGGGGVFPAILYGDQDYTKITPGVIYKFREDWAVQFDAIHIAAGKNIVSGTTFSLGIVKMGI